MHDSPHTHHHSPSSNFRQVSEREFPAGFSHIQKKKLSVSFHSMSLLFSSSPKLTEQLIYHCPGYSDSILHCPLNSLWGSQSHKTAKEGSVLSRPSLSRWGEVPCSTKKYGPSDFCIHKASDRGFLPRINAREIRETRVKDGLQQLLKSEKTPEVTEGCLNWCVWRAGEWR